MAAEGRLRWSSVLRILAVVAPPLSIAWLLHRYGVDVPIGDQWSAIAPLFEKMEAGTLGWADFYSQLNEHRIFFPRLIIVGLALLTDWNIYAELFVMWAMAVVSGLLLWKLGRATAPPGSAPITWLLVAQSALLFAPQQYDNWLMGLQIVVWLPLACITACALIAQLPSTPVRYVATAILAVISTFSLASGFLCWLVTVPLLALRAERDGWPGQRVWLAGWLASFAASFALYLTGYQKPSHLPDLMALVGHPLDAIEFVCAYLGNSFAMGTLPAFPVAVIAGALLLLLLVACLAHLWRWRRDRELLARGLPWLVLPGFAVGNAVLTALGRGGWGVNAGMTSRYVTLSLPLSIGLMLLVPIVFGHWREHARSQQASRFAQTALTAMVTGYALLYLLSAAVSISSWAEVSRTIWIGRGLIQLIGVVDEPEQLAAYVHPVASPLRSRAFALDRLGFLRPGLVHSSSIAEIADPQDPGAPDYGVIERSGFMGSGAWGAVGWAILPHARRPADAVVLTYEIPGRDPIIFALAEIGRPRYDVADAASEPRYLRSGWSRRLDRARIPSEAVAVKAWALDAERGRAYRLAGEARVTATH